MMVLWGNYEILIGDALQGKYSTRGGIWGLTDLPPHLFSVFLHVCDQTTPCLGAVLPLTVAVPFLLC